MFASFTKIIDRKSQELIYSYIVVDSTLIYCYIISTKNLVISLIIVVMIGKEMPKQQEIPDSFMEIFGASSTGRSHCEHHAT